MEPATEEQLAAARDAGLLAPDEDQSGPEKDEDQVLDDFIGRHLPGSGEWREMG